MKRVTAVEEQLPAYNKQLQALEQMFSAADKAFEKGNRRPLNDLHGCLCLM